MDCMGLFVLYAFVVLRAMVMPTIGLLRFPSLFATKNNFFLGLTKF